MPRQKKTAVTQVEAVRELGYEVALACEVDGVSVWRVEGFGVSLMVRDDDEEALASLADPKLHKEREKQFEAGSEAEPPDES